MSKKVNDRITIRALGYYLIAQAPYHSNLRNPPTLKKRIGSHLIATADF